MAKSSSGYSAPDFRTLFESVPGLYLILTPNWTIAAVSDAYLRATLTRRDEILGRGLFDVFPDNPDDPAASGVQNLKASLMRVRSTRAADTMATQKYDIRKPESEGGGFTERYWSPANSPMLDDAGEIAYIIHSAEDITESVHLRQYGSEQKKLNEERRQAESKLRAQVTRLALLSHITRAVGERQDSQSIFQVVANTVEEQLPVDICCICLCDPVTSELTVASIGARNGVPASDLHTGGQMYVSMDKTALSSCVRGELVYEPHAGERRFAFPRHLSNVSLHSVVAAPLLVEREIFGVLLAGRHPAQSFTPDDCEFLKQLSEHTALAAHQAQLHSALQKAYDDLRQTQQAVMQQERLRALGQMASGIAHDINNAISPVALYTESLLEREPDLSARTRDYLETIQRAIHDVSQTVARMREFYRQREPQLCLVPVDVNRLVKQVIDLTRARWSDMAQQRGSVIEISTDLAPHLPEIMGAESEIREALTNLIFNAVDAMPEGGKLKLRTAILHPESTSARQTGGERQVCLEVIDAGIGMDEDTRRRCLEPFFTTKGERGTGLGLAMVYGVVQRHSADLGIDSIKGKGTTMRLTFAVPSAVVVQPAAPATKQSQSVPWRILLVDDDPMLLKSLCDTLETEGHVLTATPGGQAGIDAFRAAHERGEPFDIVITDLGMPYVDGRKVASTLKALAPEIPIILLTGWGERMLAESDIPPHVDRVLGKPPKLAELQAVMAALAVAKPER